jgi:hypothetical protein
LRFSQEPALSLSKGWAAMLHLLFGFVLGVIKHTCDKKPFLYESQPTSKWFYANLLREAIRPSPGWIFGSAD